MGTTPFITVRANRPLSEIEFCAWVAQAVSGDRLEYHRGFLAGDIVPSVSSLAANERTELSLLATRAAWVEAQGLVHLVQQRLGPDLFAYLAIARPQKGAVRSVAVKQLAAAA